jgi:putative ABC transport system substrate-binding protein
MSFMTGISLNRTRKALLFTAALLWCLFVSTHRAAAYEVIIVKDADIKPYREAIEGFKSSCGCIVKELDLSDTEALERAVKARPDAVVAVGTDSFWRVKRIKTIPVIYTMVVPSDTTDRFQNNVSGVSMEIAPEAYLTAIVEVFPSAKRVGVLFDPTFTNAVVLKVTSEAHTRGIKLAAKIVLDASDVPALLDELHGKIDVLWMPPGASFANAETVEYLMLYSFQNNLPIFSFSKKMASLGAVAALYVSPHDMGAQAGEMTRRLVQGEKGPVREYAKHTHVIVNRKVAAKLGVKINAEISGRVETMEFAAD